MMAEPLSIGQDIRTDRPKSLNIAYHRALMTTNLCLIYEISS